MARQLSALKVIIRLKTDGGALYPNFNSLSTVQATGLDWSRYVDVYGLGWHYDKTCGHTQEAVGSPVGTQIGVLIVPKTFVDEAISTFPSDCSKLTELELEDFYNNKAHVTEPDELFDMEILEGIQFKQSFGLALTAQQIDAIDPTKDTPGIRKNKSRLWADYKKETSITIEAN